MPALACVCVLVVSAPDDPPRRHDGSAADRPRPERQPDLCRLRHPRSQHHLDQVRRRLSAHGLRSVQGQSRSVQGQFRVSHAQFRVSHAQFRVSHAHFRVSHAQFRVSHAQFRVSSGSVTLSKEGGGFPAHFYSSLWWKTKISLEMKGGAEKRVMIW